MSGSWIVYLWLYNFPLGKWGRSSRHAFWQRCLVTVGPSVCNMGTRLVPIPPLFYYLSPLLWFALTCMLMQKSDKKWGETLDCSSYEWHQACVSGAHIQLVKWWNTQTAYTHLVSTWCLSHDEWSQGFPISCHFLLSSQKRTKQQQKTNGQRQSRETGEQDKI